ncbi:MAG: hypothetical protein AB8F74_12725 [Saprospiraceae bacterium]
MTARFLSFLFVTMLLQLTSCKEDEEVINFITKEDLIINAPLPNQISESSGLICVDDQSFWTHNDSGDGPFLYQLDLNNQDLIRKAVLKNTSSVDWEFVTKDDNHIYIGDTGNNNGDRTDLAIHYFPTIDLQNDSITVNSLFIKYKNQSDFTKRANHNFDCEAVVPLGDDLYLFTKNRANLETDIYKVPKALGTYSLEKEGSISVDGLITDAAISPSKKTICLLGYNEIEDVFRPFFWLIYDFEGTDFLNGKKKLIDLDLTTQTEGVCFLNETFIYFSSEAEGGGTARFYAVDLEAWL